MIKNTTKYLKLFTCLATFLPLSAAIQVGAEDGSRALHLSAPEPLTPLANDLMKYFSVDDQPHVVSYTRKIKPVCYKEFMRVFLEISEKNDTEKNMDILKNLGGIRPEVLTEDYIKTVKALYDKVGFVSSSVVYKVGRINPSRYQELIAAVAAAEKKAKLSTLREFPES